MTVDPKTLRRGIYRYTNPGGLPSDAQVRDVNGGSEAPLDEATYRARGYAPPFEKLPWRTDYLAGEAAQRAAPLPPPSATGNGE